MGSPQRGRLATSLERIEQASLNQLMAEFPAQWRALGEQLVAASKGGPQALDALIKQTRSVAAPWRARVERSHGNPQVLTQALPSLVAARMAQLALERMLQSAATGIAEGTVRLGLLRGLLVQQLLFSKGLTRKPVSLTAFRALWPLVGGDRRKLLALVQPKGIYCFYSAALIAQLALLFAGRECLEVAAGDGTLTRFLTAAGVPARATDDFSWAHAVTYPENVERLDAAAALAKYRPKVALCSFPPPGNTFERRLLADPNLELYVVVTTRHRFAAGDWAAYEASPRLTLTVDERLSKLVLPPELDPVVLRFEAPPKAGDKAHSASVQRDA